MARKKQRKVSKNVRRYVKKQIGDSIQTSIKHTTLTEQALVSTTTCAIQNLTDMVFVDRGAINAHGYEARAFGLHLNYMILSSGTSVTIPQYVRVMVINCMPQEYELITDEFLTVDNGDGKALTASLLMDIVNPLNKKGFGVLYDRVHKLEGQGDGQGQSSVKVKKLLKFNHNKQWDNNSNNTDSKKNNLRFLIFNREIDNDANAVTCEWSLFSRYYFKNI